MDEEKKSLEVQEQDSVRAEEMERMRDCPCFIPRADIFENEEGYIVILDMPGIDEASLEITLEKQILNINGRTQIEAPEGYSLALSEYRVGDYERSFRLTDSIARDQIEAVYANGVLRLSLPKAEEAKPRKIAVKTG
jgi:HSP20 family molecular chaperone IbpA